MNNFREYFEMRLKASNSKKLEAVEYDGYFGEIKKIENKKKFFLKDSTKEYDIYDKIKPILNEKIGHSILKELKKYNKSIKIPNKIFITYSLDKDSFEYTDSIKDLIVFEIGISSFKINSKTIESAIYNLKKDEKDDDKIDKFLLRKFLIFNMYLIPMLLIGNKDFHSENLIVKTRNTKIKDYYVIDFGNAFEKSTPMEVNYMKKIFFYDPKSSKKSKYEILNWDSLFFKKGIGNKIIRILEKQKDHIAKIDFKSIVSKEINMFSILFDKIIKQIKSMNINIDESELNKYIDEFYSNLKTLEKEYIDVLTNNQKVVVNFVDHIKNRLKSEKK